jgi:hypothetical protein
VTPIIAISIVLYKEQLPEWLFSLVVTCTASPGAMMDGMRQVTSESAADTFEPDKGPCSASTIKQHCMYCKGCISAHSNGAAACCDTTCQQLEAAEMMARLQYVNRAAAVAGWFDWCIAVTGACVGLRGCCRLGPSCTAWILHGR